MRLLERFATLAAVARRTGADQIGPTVAAAPRARNDMVECEVSALCPTILATITIASENGAARQFETRVWTPYGVRQSND